jgi:hypothetical protein
MRLYFSSNNTRDSDWNERNHGLNLLVRLSMIQGLTPGNDLETNFGTFDPTIPEVDPECLLWRTCEVFARTGAGPSW